MDQNRRWGGVVAVGFVIAALSVACGGQAGLLPGDGGNSMTCPLVGCASNEILDPTTCTCTIVDNEPDAGDVADTATEGPDATMVCVLPCPTRSVPAIVGGQCACVPIDSGVSVVDGPVDDEAAPDAAHDSPYDAPVDHAVPVDAPVDAPTAFDEASYDAPFYDAPFYDATSLDAPSGCLPTDCGPGFEATPSCQCLQCTSTCPAGQTPAAGCATCEACPASCPAGFDFAAGCTCVPHGVEAGPPDASDGGGVSCTLEGFNVCPAGSWCELGLCPDGKTQFGCFCDAEGNTTCNLDCPTPPPCTIPGQGSCPYGAQCIFDGCPTPSSTAFVCDCQGGGASCFSSPCGAIDGGITILPDAGAVDAGVTCLLEGYLACPAGSFCALGTCPDGTTPYGCTCNADGTATCNLECPAQPPCTIPGEGTCPANTECTFGTCAADGTGTLLSCFCESGGSASCWTSSCGANEGGIP